MKKFISFIFIYMFSLSISAAQDSSYKYLNINSKDSSTYNWHVLEYAAIFNRPKYGANLYFFYNNSFKNKPIADMLNSIKMKFPYIGESFSSTGNKSHKNDTSKTCNIVNYHFKYDDTMMLTMTCWIPITRGVSQKDDKILDYFAGQFEFNAITYTENADNLLLNGILTHIKQDKTADRTLLNLIYDNYPNLRHKIDSFLKDYQFFLKL